MGLGCVEEGGRQEGMGWDSWWCGSLIIAERRVESAWETGEFVRSYIRAETWSL